MTFTYPIYITNIVNNIRCRDWKTATTPITILLATGEKITGVIEINLESNCFILNKRIVIPNISFGFLAPDTDQPILVSLRDANDLRLTNYVCYEQLNGWIKYCPKCGNKLPLVYFDYNGRFTTEERDQSDCSGCRGGY